MDPDLLLDVIALLALAACSISLFALTRLCEALR
jgi:hypothetical protein